MLIKDYFVTATSSAADAALASAGEPLRLLRKPSVAAAPGAVFSFLADS